MAESIDDYHKKYGVRPVRYYVMVWMYMTSSYLQFRFFYALFRDDSYIHVINNVLVVWYIKFLVACMEKHVVSLFKEQFCRITINQY